MKVVELSNAMASQPFKLTFFFNDSAQSGVPIPEHRVGRERVHTNVRYDDDVDSDTGRG